MTRYNENLEEYDEMSEEAEEYSEEDAEELGDEWRREMEMSGVSWARDIEKIDDPGARKREIEAAKDIMEMEEDLNDRLSSGEISEQGYEREYKEEVMRDKIHAITRSFLEKKGIPAENLGGIFDGWDDPHRPLSRRDLTASELDKVTEAIGPEGIKELNDRMFAEGNISEETHEKISERIHNNREEEGIREEEDERVDEEDVEEDV